MTPQSSDATEEANDPRAEAPGAPSRPRHHRGRDGEQFRLPARLLCVAFVLCGQVRAGAEDDVAYFDKHIRPVLATHCYECHSAERGTTKGGLDLSHRQGMRSGGERGPALVPGKPAESLILRAIRHETLNMPRKADRLPDAVIDHVETWIAMGAPDPRNDAAKFDRSGIDWDAARRWWAFQPVANVPVPNVQNPAWPRADLDHFVLHRLENEDLTPAPDADRATWLRRVTFDLTGLPPTPTEVRGFLRDTADGARTRVVDRLLASPQFGVHFGRLWLDGARFRTRMEFARRYRLWVVDAFNSDKPYDQFVREQLAGDLLLEVGPDGRFDPDPLIGTAVMGLAVGGCDTTERQLEFVGQQLMGLSIACARCHDHKFDPFTQKDYYALAGILQSSEICGDKNDALPLVTSLREREAYEADLKQRARLSKELASLREQHPQLYKLVELQEHLAEREHERQRKQLDELLADQKQKGWDLNPPERPRLRELWLEQRALGRRIQATPTILALREDKIRDVPVLRNGERNQAGEIVPRRLPTVFEGPDQTPIGERTDQSGRLELARWIASPDHPLTARVMANRVWLWLMGAGIVATPNDFGKTGEPPSHPELLDHLAGRLVERGWSVKALAREIVLSRAYGLSAVADERLRTGDPVNRWFGRARMERLRYEQILDAVHFVSGHLELDPGPELLLEKRPPKELRVREMYYDGRLEEKLFDGADGDLIVDQRYESVIAPQLLYFLNSREVRDAAELLAKRLESPAGPERLATLYLTVFGREPTAAERTEAAAFIERFSFARYCHALLCSNEFIYLQ